MTDFDPNKRKFLTSSLMIGCSLAASPLFTPMTLASTPNDNRLVVIILRGGADGLDMIQPLHDPEFANLLEGRSTQGPELEGGYRLHEALSPLHPLWQAGQLSFAHAVSTPYRDKRSHFDGQDILEAGVASADTDSLRQGWLNRLLQTMPDVETETTYTVGRGDMLLTQGPAQVANWAPNANLFLSPQAHRLIELIMHKDPLFRDATEEALLLSEDERAVKFDGEDPDTGQMINTMRRSIETTTGGVDNIARFAAQRLRDQTRIATFSLGGFDSHNRQDRVLTRSLSNLSTAILTLKQELGPVWDKTTVLAMTEFGRTVRMNGTGGTDHGTGGALFVAGGNLARAQVVTKWPGLAEADLYKRRDLMPTRDIRAHTAWVLRALFDTNKTLLETQVFPGLNMGTNPGLIA